MSTLKQSAVLAAVFLGVFVGSARAQDTVTVKVPFPFVVHGEEFVAGPYEIKADYHGILSIRNTDDGSGLFALTTPADGTDPAGHDAALVFTHYENEYLLSQIWESNTDGFALPEQSMVPRRAEAAVDDPAVVLAVSGR
jgi:hypothetical protein